ncbi:MAG: flagellar assembly protein FliH [Treponema sp.]|jgi:flagellar assembly protein FliH|nr:flagellar assembly protein FliH [Treponema sp.]
MLKAVFRNSELVELPDKIVLDPPTNFIELSHLTPVEDEVEDLVDMEEYRGPTIDEIRREAEAFKIHWEEEKEKMFADSKEEAKNIIKDAQDAAFREVQRGTDESLVIKQRAEEEAERIIADAGIKAAEIENEARLSLENIQKEARDKGREEGREDGYGEGKAEVDRLIERTQTILERASNKRGEILSETEQQVIELVLLIARKVVKTISENQRDVIIPNIVEALRKVKAKGDIIIRVNLVDLQMATEHKEDFIRLMEGANSIQLVEDTKVDPGGCIIETDFGEIDARIASQLAELESKILEISPSKSTIQGTIPQPVVRTANLNADLTATSALMGMEKLKPQKRRSVDGDAEEDVDEAETANAALTASAALAALATMSMKGKRESDKQILAAVEKNKQKE